MSLVSQFTRGQHADFLRQPPLIYPMTTATKFKVHLLFFPPISTQGASSCDVGDAE
ncbi:hypothetical protein CY34DRAFT_814277 [Suillus luteus UH-Slu-Lm8-n1]|uniref:Uncharacterized protein n=1 Tax=Suillus luteus UH-Slu-Lm8-n1 TaxID=930992 RepID=A0A0C9Z4T2_9AGAM|nr:hypothetical protein CY34DRAFT_814277 [Suillus luteus UH-Slu-Lm8-n1]